MTTMLAEERCAGRAVLDVEREGIVFHNVAPGRVRIEVTVRNTGDARSDATPVALRVAPLGAFLPWRPLRTLMAPPIEPGDERRIGLEVEQPPVKLAGAFWRVPRERLLTAIGVEEAEPREERGSILAFINRLRRAQRLRRAAGWPQPIRGLSPDLFEVLGHGNLHWAGNIEVFVGRRRVERHMAPLVRLYPGRRNVAHFLVGKGQDAYAFKLGGEPALVRCASVYEDLRRSSMFAAPADGRRLDDGEWKEVRRSIVVGLRVDVPSECRQGKLDVQVRQRSTGKEAIVEFNLDADAAGPGCFVV